VEPEVGLRAEPPRLRENAGVPAPGVDSHPPGIADSTEPDRPAARARPPQLVPGWPRSAGWSALTALLLTAGALGAGQAALSLQRYYQDQRAAGGQLNTFTQLLADGSGPRTSWAGWAAAFFFAVSAVPLVWGRPEPPLRTRSGGGVGTIRAALRRELFVVRAALVIVGLLALLDSGRAAAYAAAADDGLSVAQGSWLATLVEAGGLVTAALVLLGWTALFRRQLRRLGAW